MQQRIPVSEYQQAVKDLINNLRADQAEHTTAEYEEVSLQDSPHVLGRVLAKDLRAAVNVPAFDNSQMDGFVYNTADLAELEIGSQVELSLMPMVPAGTMAPKLLPGAAAPIMTGAPIPEGANCVIPVEETTQAAFAVNENPAEVLQFQLRPEHLQAGRFIRKFGSDTQRHEVVARVGQVLNSRLIGHLGSVGLKNVPVLPKLKAVVVSTGSELAPVSAVSTGEGQIFDANGPSLSAALTGMGVEVVAQLQAPDDAAQLLQSVQAAVQASGAQLIVSSGGVSAGAKEPVKQLRELGVQLAFQKVAIQPGGPQGLGWLPHENGRAAWIALPGNPVSCLLSLEIFVREALGAPPLLSLQLPISTDYGKAENSPEGLLQVRRARVTPSGKARLVGGPGSHLLAALSLSNALVLVPPEKTEINEGDVLEVRILN